MGKSVLVIDAGGRGSALVAAYAKSKQVEKVFAVPGNDLMQLNFKKPVQTFPNLKTTNIKEIVKIARDHKIHLVDIAQDNAIAAGLVDQLQTIGVNVVGPNRDAGQIEWDKAWSREFMLRWKLPIPKFKICHSSKEGMNFLQKQRDNSWFIKASGLADGKGVIPAGNNREAVEAIKKMSLFGSAGETFLIEQCLIGEEFSFFAISDGNTYKIIGSAQDHKRLYNFDQGPNTGGMGCSSLPLVVSKSIYHQAETIIKTALAGLKKENRVYKGVLYLGAIVVQGEVYVIEFNARWGDPEAEVLVPSIQTDFYQLGMAIVEGNLNKINLKTDTLSRVVVTVALRPGVDSSKPLRVYGIDEILKLKDITLYNSRIIKNGQGYFAGSGRLIHIVASGKDIVEARKKAYEAATLIYIEGNNAHYRTDIGWRDVERFCSLSS